MNSPAVIPNSHISVSGSINALILSLTRTFRGKVIFQSKELHLSVEFHMPCNSLLTTPMSERVVEVNVKESFSPANFLLLVKLLQGFLRHSKSS